MAIKNLRSKESINYEMKYGGLLYLSAAAIGGCFLMMGLVSASILIEANHRWDLNEFTKRKQYIVERKEEFLKELSKPENRYNDALVDSVMKYYNKEITIDVKIEEAERGIYRAQLRP